MEAFSLKDHFVHTNMYQLMYKRRNVLWLSFKWLRLPQLNNQVGIYIETLGQFQRRYFLSKRKVGSFDLDFWAIVIHCSPKTKLCLHADQIRPSLQRYQKHTSNVFQKRTSSITKKKKKVDNFFLFFCQSSLMTQSILVKLQRPQFSSGSHSEYSLHSCR